MLKRNISHKDIVSRDALCSALNQKEKIITLLEKELKHYSTLRSDFDKIARKKQQAIKQCDSISLKIHDYQQLKQEQSTIDTHNANDLQNSINSLTTQLTKNRNYYKGLQSQHEFMTGKCRQRQQHTQQQLQNIQRIKFQNGQLKIQETRLNSNISQLTNQLKSLSNQHQKLQYSIQNICSQIFKTQQFVRSVRLEQAKLNQQLGQYSRQNQEAEDIISDLEKCKKSVDGKIRQMKESIQHQKMQLKTKKIKLGRNSAQHCQKMKFFKKQSQKESSMKQLVNKRQRQISKISTIMSQIVSDNQKLIGQNMEIQQINSKINGDMMLCVKHLQNIEENNKNMNMQIMGYQQINLGVIKKLEKIMGSSLLKKEEKTMRSDAHLTQFVWKNQENAVKYWQKNGNQLLETADVFHHRSAYNTKTSN